MKKLFTLFLLTIITLAVKSQIVVNLNAAKDNTIYSENTNSNGIGEHFFAGKTASGATRRGLIQFNLATIPSGSTITSVTLTLYGTKVINTGGIGLHKLTQNWGEGTSDAASNEGTGITATTNDATWIHSFFPSSNWTTTGGSFSGTVSASIPTVVAGINNMIDGGLIADVQGFVNNSATNFGWIIRGTETGTNTAIRFGTKDNLTSTFRPVLKVTYSPPLPVTLKSFKATLQNQQTFLTWKTATEINNDYFEVEHSNDAVRFSPVGKVKGNGNLVIEQSYAFIHSNIKKGKQFYRLAQYDFDGTVRYSPVLVVIAGSAISLQISPNPARNILNVVASSTLENTKYTVHSSNGKLVLQGILNAGKIKIDRLFPGMYWLKITDGEGETIQKRFIKQ